jgi:DNA (cytosine-5)-methyltransferase 1
MPLGEQEYSKHSATVVERFRYMLENHGEIPEHLKTKKFAQRALTKVWGNSGPNITATSLPDDFVHYEQARTLTVREWARLQTFPDWYQFAGKRTTGGIRRAGNPREGIFDREVPKYTQIGNAVPVKLGREVGKHFLSLLK